jgi:hypothetical protein
MANVTYDLTWREAMAELLDLLEAESPEDPALAPKTLGEWACIYIKYLNIFRKLEDSYDQMVHPQKRMVSFVCGTGDGLEGGGRGALHHFSSCKISLSNSLSTLQN